MSLRYDGATEYAYFLTSSPDTVWTAVGWIYIVTDGDTAVPLLWTNDGATAFVTAGLSTDGTSPRISTSAGASADSASQSTGTWFHVAIVRNGVNATLYVAGNSAATFGSAPSYTPAAFIIGGNGTVALNGRAARVRLWLAALSEAEIEAEMASNTVVRTADLYANWPLIDNLNDISGNGRTLTFNGTPSYEADPPFGSSSVSPSVSPSLSPSASVSPSVSPSASASLSPSASVSPSTSPSVSPSPSSSVSPSVSPSPSYPIGSVCWGHVTGVLEENVRTFTGRWSGTGSIAGTGDTERLEMQSGQTMESEVVYTGEVPVTLLQNVYSAGDIVTLRYRHGATEAACLAASWTGYVSPFNSAGFVQIRLEAA